MSDDLYKRAREAASVETAAGVRLFRLGHRLRGQCPVCKSGKGKKTDGPFWCDPDKGVWGCFAGGPECQRGGDVIDLVALMDNKSRREAAEALAGSSWTAPQAQPIEPRRAAPAGPSTLAARLNREARSVTEGSPVDRYLAWRGIGPAIREALRWGLRYHPDAFWGFHQDRALSLPAMIAGPETANSRTGGVHVTYLAPGGEGKARISPAKRMFGPQSHAGKPGGVRLTPMDGPWTDRPLIVAEGIENAASAGEIYWRGTGVVPRMAAALSLDRLQGGWADDGRGRFNVDAPTADHGKPAFTWPDAGEVLIAVDRDMKPVPVFVRGPGGRRLQRDLDGEDRMRICGALAAQHWTNAGANRVRLIAPPAGLDFNDFLREGAA